VAAPSKSSVDRELVHNRLPLLRADRGMSRAALAEELGIHYQTIGYIERGEYAPSLHLALRIEPFGQLGADALLARAAIEPDRH
jgi:putative transcriptional regulator